MDEQTEFSLEEYFGEMKLMFQSKGWDFLTMELKENARIIDNIQGIDNERELDFAKGQLSVIGMVLNFPETIERAEAEQPE